MTDSERQRLAANKEDMVELKEIQEKLEKRKGNRDKLENKK